MKCDLRFIYEQMDSPHRRVQVLMLSPAWLLTILSTRAPDWCQFEGLPPDSDVIGLFTDPVQPGLLVLVESPQFELVDLRANELPELRLAMTMNSHVEPHGEHEPW